MYLCAVFLKYPKSHKDIILKYSITLVKVKVARIVRTDLNVLQYHK